MKVITGISQNIKPFIDLIKENKNEYIKNFEEKKIIYFPESGLDLNEQAAYMKNMNESDVVIFTYSPYIISDTPTKFLFIVCDNLEIDKPDFNNFGASANKISMHILQRKSTIGDLSLDIVNQYQEKLNNDEIFDFQDMDKTLGESVEKTLLSKYYFDKEESILEKSKHFISDLFK